MRLLPMLAVALLAGTAPASADAPEAAMTERVRAQVPADWAVRTRWRDRTLTTFLMPPIQASFDLFYDPAKGADLVGRLCPPSGDPLWQAVGADADIAIEPTVMGKSGMRISCRKTVAEAPGS